MSEHEPTAAFDFHGTSQQNEADFNESYKQLAQTIHRDLIGKNPSDLDLKRSTVSLGLLDGSLSWLGSVHCDPVLALADRIGVIKAVVEELEALVVPEGIRRDRGEMSNNEPTELFARFTALIGTDPDPKTSPSSHKPLGIAQKMLGLDDPDMMESLRSHLRARANKEQTERHRRSETEDEK